MKQRMVPERYLAALVRLYQAERAYVGALDLAETVTTAGERNRAYETADDALDAIWDGVAELDRLRAEIARAVREGRTG